MDLQKFFSKLRKQEIRIWLANEPTVVEDTDLARMEAANLKIDSNVRLDRAIGMAFAALFEITARFKKLHNMQANPCDCLAIRYAESILEHCAQINIEMAEINASRGFEEKPKDNDQQSV